MDQRICHVHHCDAEDGAMPPFQKNIVADMLAIMIERSKVDGQIEGLIPHLIDGDLSILYYADDTIFYGP
jgi:hypothetical protein